MSAEQAMMGEQVDDQEQARLTKRNRNKAIVGGLLFAFALFAFVSVILAKVTS